MSSREVLTRRVREGALWLGAVLGVLCLLLAAVAWIFDVRPLVFRSGSMSPEIEAGALALAREVPASEVSVGDVVSVVDGKGVRVTHRVVAVDRAGDGVSLQLQGDANATPDAETYSVEEVYRVFVDVPWAGHVVNALSTPWGLLACGGFVTLLLVTAFGRRGSGGATDGGTGGGDGGRRATRTVAGVATMGALAVAVAPMGTMATFSDTSRVTSGGLVPLTVPVPGSPSCVSSGPVAPGIDITWTHMNANATYNFEIRKRADGAVVSQTPITPSGPVGSRQKVVVDPNTYGIGRNTDYTAFIQTKLGSWSSAYTAGVPFRSGLLNGFTYCGWGPL